MTIRLLRHLHHNVTKPVLRVKHDLLRTALGKPTRRDETPRPAAPTAGPEAGPAEVHEPTRPAKTPTPSRSPKSTKTPKPTKTPSATKTPKQAPKPTTPRGAATAQRTKAELYEEATRRDVKGRSSMTKAQLARALADD